MLQRFRPKLSYANVVSTICLFIVLGGSAYAASQLPKNSVGTKQLKNKAVTGVKVKDGSLTGVDVNASTLGTVPKATAAETAATAGKANSADSAGTAGSAATAGNAERLGGTAAASYLQRSEAIPASALTGTYANPQIAGPEPWHEVGTAGNPAFGTSGGCTGPGSACWGNFGGGAATVGFYRDQIGVVHLKGFAKNISGAISGTIRIFQLPAGFRPAEDAQFAADVVGAGVGAVAVPKSGEVFLPVPETIANNGAISLDGAIFRCGPSGVSGCP